MTRHVNLSNLLEAMAAHKDVLIKEAELALAACGLGRSEPSIIKSFVLDQGKGVDFLNRRFATTFNASQQRLVLKFAGIYAHQRPYVCRAPANVAIQPGSNPTEECELADLGFLAVFVDRAKNVIAARASLFQAKKEEKLDNATQRLLYDHDDQFDYKSATFVEHASCKQASRRLPDWDDGRATALQYLILNPVAGQPLARLSPWSVSHRHSFGFFLYRLLTLSEGKNYEHSAAMAGAWSSIVNDLLRMAATGMGNSKTPRGSPDLDVVIDYFNDFHSHARYCYEPQGEGVPLVIAIVQDTQAG